MSQYELLDAFTTHGLAILTIQFGFISATSAFVAIAYIAGKELPPRIATLAVVLYAFMAIFFTGVTIQFGRGLIDIRNQMSDAGLIWYAAARESDWIAPGIVITFVLVMLLISFGALSYFIHARKIAA